MKKSVINLVIVLFTIIVGGVNISYQFVDKKDNRGLITDNIEAFANPEVSTPGVLIGNCNGSVVITTDCKVTCWKCNRVYYPTPRVNHAVAANISGYCVCGNSMFAGN